MARDPRGVPDVVFKPTKYMNFVGAIGKRKELEANRKMEKAAKKRAEIPEVETGKYLAFWRPLVGQAAQKYTQLRSKFIQNFDQMTPEQRAKEKRRLDNLRLNLAGIAEDMEASAKKQKEVEEELNNFYKEHPSAEASPATFLRAHEGSSMAKNLKSLLNAKQHWSGAKLANAEVQINENGEILFDSPDTPANNLKQYSNFRQVAYVPEWDFQKEVADRNIIPFNEKTVKIDGVTRVKLDEEDLNDSFETFVLNNNLDSQYAKFSKWFRDNYNGDAEEAAVAWREMHKKWNQQGVMTPKAKKYYEGIKQAAKSSLGEQYKENDDKTVSFAWGNAPIDKTPGRGYTDVNKGDSLYDNLSKGLNVKYKTDKPKGLMKEGIAFSEEKNIDVAVEETDFPSMGAGDIAEETKSTLSNIYKGEDGKKFMIVRGFRKNGREILSKPIRLNETKKARIEDALDLKQGSFDEWYEAKVGKTEGDFSGEPNEGAQDETGLPSIEEAESMISNNNSTR